MSFLLDTNVLSEMAKDEADEGVVRWLREVEEDEAFISVVTMAELRYGVERLADGRRRRRLREWLDEAVPARFDGRVVPIDVAVAAEWGVVVAARERLGRPMGAMDGLIAATARLGSLALVTRNTDDFLDLDIALVNPFQGKDTQADGASARA